MNAQEFEKYAGKHTKGKKGGDSLSGGKIIGYDPKDVHPLQLLAIDDIYGDSGRMFEVVIPDKDDFKDYLCWKHKYIWVTVENVIMDESKEITEQIKNKQFMETRSVKMTLETAKRWKEMGGEYEQVAVETFPELAGVKNEWSKKFIDKMIEGFYIFGASVRKIYQCDGYKDCANLFKTEKQAKSALAYAQLTQLMALPEYNGDWVADWSDISECKYVLCRLRKKIEVDSTVYLHFPISFKTAEICDKFLKNNRDLLKQYFEL